MRKLLSLIAVVVTLFTLTVPAWAMPVGDLETPLSPQAAKSLLDRIYESVKNGEEPIVVFDLDDTLYRWPSKEAVTPNRIRGAARYVRLLQSAGAKIVYLTGREETLRGETERLLKDFRVPLKNTTLIMNDMGLPTVQYKEAALANVKGNVVALFDNEMENVRMYRAVYPNRNVKVVRLATVSNRPDPGGTGHISVIRDFDRHPRLRAMFKAFTDRVRRLPPPPRPLGFAH